MTRASCGDHGEFPSNDGQVRGQFAHRLHFRAREQREARGVEPQILEILTKSLDHRMNLENVQEVSKQTFCC